jgi:Uma2 family endonuclease
LDEASPIWIGFIRPASTFFRFPDFINCKASPEHSCIFVRNLPINPMGNALEQPPRFLASREEYFEWEDKANHKSEYLSGEIVAMSGGSLNHNTIGVNVISSLHHLLRRGPCRVFNSDTKLEIASDGSYVYPDAMVVCGEVKTAEDRNDIVTNPVLVIEVLSPPTENLDRGKKIRYYQSLPTLQEYILISSQLPYIESYFRQSENSWQFTVARELTDTLSIQSLRLQVTLADWYENISFDESI